MNSRNFRQGLTRRGFANAMAATSIALRVESTAQWSELFNGRTRDDWKPSETQEVVDRHKRHPHRERPLFTSFLRGTGSRGGLQEL